MSTTTSLVDFYGDLLRSLGVKVDDDGLLSIESFGVSKPLEIDDRRLALPTRDVLRSVGQGSDLIPYHPMSESANRGESPVLQLTKKLVRLRLTASFVGLFSGLVELCANRDAHGALSPDAHRVLSCLPEADAKTLEAVDKILRAMNEDSKRMINIYLKRKGKISGQEFSRVAVFRLPLYDEFADETNTEVFGVKLRKKDFHGLKKLIEYILPDIGTAEDYMIGSNNLLVPYLDSLCRIYAQVSKQLNKIYKVHKASIDSEIKIAASWIKSNKELDWSQWRDAIPPLEDSMGVLLESEGEANRRQAMGREVPTDMLKTRTPARAAPVQEKATAVDTPPWDTSTGTTSTVGQRPAVLTVGAAAKPEERRSTKSIDDVLNAGRQHQPQPQYQYGAAPVHATPGTYGVPAYGAPAYGAPPARPGDYPGRVRGIAPQPQYQYGGYQQQPYAQPAAQPGVGAAAGAFAPPTTTYGMPAYGHQPYQPGVQYAQPGLRV